MIKSSLANLVRPSDGRMITINKRKVNVLIILERFSAVFVQYPINLSLKATKLGRVTAASHNRNVGIVS